MTNAAASEIRGSVRAARSLGRLGWSALLVTTAALIGCLVVFESASFLGFAINGDTLHLALTVWDYSAHDYAREGYGKSSLVRRMATGAAYFGAIPLVLGEAVLQQPLQTTHRRPPVTTCLAIALLIPARSRRSV